MSRNIRKWLVYTLVVLAVVVILGLWLLPEPVTVEMFEVDSGPLVVTVEEQGRTQALNRYSVAAPISGRLMRTPFREGDWVEKDAVLAHIAPPPEDLREEATLRAALAAAEAHQREAAAHLEEAQSNLRQAEGEAVRRSELHERGLVSIEERDRFVQAADGARARQSSAEASMAAAEANVESARARLLGLYGSQDGGGMAEVKAPVAGRVLVVYEESERVVQAGSPLFDLSEGDALELVIDVLTQEAVQVDPGDEIIITDWGGQDVLKGVVRIVEPCAYMKVSTLGVEEQRVNIIGDFIESPPSLGAEYRVQAAIVVWQSDSVTRIATSAIFRHRGAWHTFVVEGGRASLRALEIGQLNDEFGEVLAGVSPGDQVIVYPSDLIIEGVRVDQSPQDRL
jgi:HlyD family secretion protein